MSEPRDGVYFVRVSDALIERLEEDWSEPVQFKVTVSESDPNELELVLRTLETSGAGWPE